MKNTSKIKIFITLIFVIVVMAFSFTFAESGNDLSWRYNPIKNTWQFFNNGRQYVNEWASCEIPYAKDAKKNAWFLFDESGNMITDFYKDPVSGLIYYFETEDNDNAIKGMMVTGDKVINGVLYHFEDTNPSILGVLVRIEK